MSTVEPVSIRLFATPREATDDDLRGSSVVVIDILRSSATIATALTSGAREIIPVQSPAEAAELAAKAGRGLSLLCGEREGHKINGFELGNSPSEYTSDRVAGRILIFSSTNGTGAILRAKVAERIYVGGFNNFGAIARRLTEDGNSIVILCSGQDEQFSLEDFICGGKFVNSLKSRLRREIILNDAAQAAALLHAQFDGDILQLLQTCNHGRYLASLGFSDDLVRCAELDITDVVPMWAEGKVKGFTVDGSPYGESAANAN
jgi:2-phosphosulfolactate phosphatase